MSARGKPRQIKLQDGRRIPFFWVDNKVIDQYLWQVGADAFAVYAIICRHARSTTQRAWPSQQTLIDISHLARNTVRKAIRKLVEARLISIKKEGRAGRCHNVYTVLHAKNKSMTRSRRDRAGSPGDPAGSCADPAGSSDDPGALNTEALGRVATRRRTRRIEQNETNEKEQEQGVIGADSAVLNSEDFAFCLEVLKRCGINTHKQNLGALRSLWALTAGSSLDRRNQFECAIDHGGSCGEGAAQIFAIAHQRLEDGIL